VLFTVFTGVTINSAVLKYSVSLKNPNPIPVQSHPTSGIVQNVNVSRISQHTYW